MDSLGYILCDLVYTIMQRNPAFVPAISRPELTEDDILRMRVSWRGDEAERGPAHEHRDRIRCFPGRGAHRTSQELHRPELQQDPVRPGGASGPASQRYRRLFTKVSGMSFSQYLRHVHIEEACRLTRTTNDKFYLIGERVGYPDPEHFARTFRTEAGCSHKEYRGLQASGEAEEWGRRCCMDKLYEIFLSV